jgi:ATP-dependent DNA helicase RecQ
MTSDDAMNELESLPNVAEILERYWGYSSLRPLQAPAIDCILQRRDSLTVLPTGGGKSLCFQVPAVCMPGMAVVVSPLISLMKDQVDSLTACGVPAAFINSTQGDDEKREVAQSIRRGELKLLYVAPERLLATRTLDFLAESNVSFFAIDEAHCISAWGHDFRPEYRGLRALKKKFPGRGIHAFTATASEPVRNDIANQLALVQPRIMVGSFDRPNLVYRMVRSQQRLAQVTEVIARHQGESGVVYCISRKEVDRTTGTLNAHGIRALPYHAGMTDEQRKANQDAFIKEQCDVIVATVAFGMGIDKSNVRYVIHAGMPKSIEHYQQESGRAGRDGLPAECVLIHAPGDLATWKMIMDGESGNGQSEAHRSLEAISHLCNSVACRHRALVEYFGQAYPKDSCDACDVCLGEIDLIDDPITVAQKVLSCVIRLEERFGAGHTVKVLTGSRDQKVKDWGHDRLSTYGLLANEGTAAVRTWIDQLVSQGFLKRTGDYQSLALTDSGRRLLKRDGNPVLSVVEHANSNRRSTMEVSWEGVDRPLFDALRKLRGQLAVARNVPAYVIFGDATLRELARYRPTTRDTFAQIRGVGQQKIKELAEPFIEAIERHCQQHALETNLPTNAFVAELSASNNVAKKAPLVDGNANAFAAFGYFDNNEPLDQIAEKLGRAKSTVHGYLMDYIRHHQITDPSRWVDEATQNLIAEQAHLAEMGRLRPVFEALEGKIPYEPIRIVMTCLEIANKIPATPK